MFKVFNDLDEIEVTADASDELPEDILLFHQGWFPEAKIIINRLVRGYTPKYPQIQKESRSTIYLSILKMKENEEKRVCHKILAHPQHS